VHLKKCIASFMCAQHGRNLTGESPECG